MENLWTPWRFHYLSSSPPEGCVFCRIPQAGEARDRENLVLARYRHAFLILNRFPYTAGHLMVVPYQHVATLDEASTATLKEVIQLASRAERVVREVYRPDGFNIGFNIGSCAGAGVAGHIHLHVVPRWTGDSNFVSVLGQTRTIPEELETTFDKLRPLLQTGEND